MVSIGLVSQHLPSWYHPPLLTPITPSPSLQLFPRLPPHYTSTMYILQRRFFIIGIHAYCMPITHPPSSASLFLSFTAVREQKYLYFHLHSCIYHHYITLDALLDVSFSPKQAHTIYFDFLPFLWFYIAYMTRESSMYIMEVYNTYVKMLQK
jgi:hypothetical protein